MAGQTDSGPAVGAVPRARARSGPCSTAAFLGTVPPVNRYEKREATYIAMETGHPRVNQELSPVVGAVVRTKPAVQYPVMLSNV